MAFENGKNRYENAWVFKALNGIRFLHPIDKETLTKMEIQLESEGRRLLVSKRTKVECNNELSDFWHLHNEKWDDYNQQR